MSKEEFPSEKDLPQEDQEKQAKSAEADKPGVKEDKKAKDNKEEAGVSWNRHQKCKKHCYKI